MDTPWGCVVWSQRWPLAAAQAGTSPCPQVAGLFLTTGCSSLPSNSSSVSLHNAQTRSFFCLLYIYTLLWLLLQAGYTAGRPLDNLSLLVPRGTLGVFSSSVWQGGGWSLDVCLSPPMLGCVATGRLLCPSTACQAVLWQAGARMSSSSCVVAGRPLCLSYFSFIYSSIL